MTDTPTGPQHTMTDTPTGPQHTITKTHSPPDWWESCRPPPVLWLPHHWTPAPPGRSPDLQRHVLVGGCTLLPVPQAAPLSHWLSLSLSSSPSVCLSGSVIGSLSPSVCLSGSVTGSLSLPLSVSPGQSLSLSHSPGQSLALSLTLSLCLSGSVTVSLSLSGSVTGSLSHSLSLCLSGSVTGSLSPSVCLSESVTGSLSLSLSPGQSLAFSLFLSPLFVSLSVSLGQLLALPLSLHVCLSGSVTGSPPPPPPPPPPSCLSSLSPPPFVSRAICLPGSITVSLSLSLVYTVLAAVNYHRHTLSQSLVAPLSLSPFSVSPTITYRSVSHCLSSYQVKVVAQHFVLERAQDRIVCIFS